MYISKFNYQLTNSLAFQVNKKHKAKSIAKGLIQMIPIIGAYSSYKSFKKTHALHNKWRSAKDDYQYDVRFSDIKSAKSIINMLGLGILIMPLRIGCTIVKQINDCLKRKCKNPHLLTGYDLKMAQFYTKEKTYCIKDHINRFPGHDQYHRRAFLRDHVQEPYMFKESLMGPDPVMRPCDIESAKAVEELKNKMFSYKEEQEAQQKKFKKRIQELSALNGSIE